MAALASGARLGPYEIVAPLGAGGMGEVYRARDTRLGRTVAIKLLNAELSGDAVSRERFEREARSIAALAHPHICTLHDVGDHEGNAFIVMELLEGHTLAARLARTKGGLKIDEALAIATQVAEALAFAHRHQIIHRDVKPANIMLTPTGVKLLDFGLARWHNRDEMSGQSRTHTFLTEPHHVMGTLAYMSPEQLDGRADPRSDVFAFGAVLFEMLTGQKAFDGAASSAVIAAIVHTDPPAVSSLRPEVSASLDRVVRRCLAKDPDARWQSTADLVDELTWIAGNPIPPGNRTGPPASRPSIAGTMVIFAVGLVFGVGLAALWLQPEAARAGQAVVKFHVASPTGMFLPPPSVAEIALSPDGSRLAFVATSPSGARQIWIRSLDDPSPELVKDSRALGVTWSPDGRQLAFYESGKLWRLDLRTGTASSVCDIEGGAVLTPSWGANGQLLFAAARGTSPILSVPAEGGSPRAVTTLAPGDAQHNYPVWLPDGDHFLFNKVSRAGSSGLHVGSVSSPEIREVAGVSGRALYSRGHVLYNRGETLFAQPFDVKRLIISGEPLVLTKFAGQNGLFSSLTVSENGALGYGGVNSTIKSRLSLVDRDGRVVRHLGAEGLFDGVRVSPDGTMVATTIIESQLLGALAIVDIAHGLPVRLTTDASRLDRFPLWTSDASALGFTSSESATRTTSVRRTPLHGKGAPDIIIAGRPEEELIANDWSRDGRFIVYRTMSKGQSDLNLLTVDSKKHESLVAGPFEEGDGRISPDGRTLAYVSDESGSDEVYLQAFPGGGRRLRVSTDGGVEPRWRADSRELFYRSGSGTLMAVQLGERGGQLVVAVQTRLAAGTRWATRGGLQPWTYDVMPDGKHFVVNAFPINTLFPDVTVVLNWPGLLPK